MDINFSSRKKKRVCLFNREVLFCFVFVFVFYVFVVVFIEMGFTV